MDVKHPVGSEILRKQNRKVDIKTMRYDMGERIVEQKERFCELEQGPKSSENVLHIVDLTYVPSYKNKRKKWKEEEYSKICFDRGLILKGQKINQKDLHLYFIELATQNSELRALNKKLSQQLEKVEKELSVLKKERKEKAARKEARTNRKRLPKR